MARNVLLLHLNLSHVNLRSFFTVIICFDSFELNTAYGLVRLSCTVSCNRSEERGLEGDTPMYVLQCGTYWTGRNGASIPVALLWK